MMELEKSLTLKEQIDVHRLPKHIAVIMDGNGRWAERHGKQRVFGHRNGVKAVREVTEAAAELGVEYLTLYAFSTENWARPAIEVNALMTLLVETLRKEIETLNKNNIRLKAIGDLQVMPAKTRRALEEGMEKTKNNERMVLTLALNYSARWEWVEASKALARDVQSGLLKPESIDSPLLSSYLSTAGMPDPELLIRTSGELRISNFLLYQLAYTELYFTEVLWPDFLKEEFYKALLSYQGRQRRFGQTGEQILK
jgi:undecaprenyl diphosphate synthase